MTFIAIIGAVMMLAIVCVYTEQRRSIAVNIEQITAAPYALILGAGVTKNKQPTIMLYDRLAMGAALFKAGKASKLLLSGDGQDRYYDEISVMYQTAIKMGVPQEALVLDPLGIRTRDSCVRARSIYNVDHAVIVTQSFHLPRALYLCRNAGITAQGVSADKHYYRKMAHYEVREWMAWLLALTETLFDFEHS